MLEVFAPSLDRSCLLEPVGERSYHMMEDIVNSEKDIVLFVGSRNQRNGHDESPLVPIVEQ